ncbi:MAG TPA: hypothetical protein VMO47_01985, partial [Rhodothermales bacterium]|nr:hypothetical protein [Rhodothermales bacterium]
MKISAYIALLVGLFGAVPASGQVSPELFDYARPSLTWYTIETEHFNVVFHHDTTGAGSSRTAQVVARIAEEIYEPITSLYQYRPDTRVTFVLKDFEDYSNGAAYFFDNKIEIWSPALDSPLRGDHNWLRNVITHEFTHMVQVQAAMKANRRLPFLYFQLLDYEDVKRPDVLYGYPDVIITYPIPVLNNPAWFAEGTAQYQREFMTYDSWDTHRDMLLRTRVLAGEELSMAEMGGFYSHSSLLRESVYNHGFAFTHYLADTFGEDVLRKLSRDLGKWSNWNVERALKDATGKAAADVYADWMRILREEYSVRTAAIRENPVEGRLIEKDGFSNFYPRFSPDGSKLAYVSNRGEHFNLMSLYVVDLESGEELTFDLGGVTHGGQLYTCSLGHQHRVRGGVGGAVTWHPSGESIAYAKTKDTPEGFRYSDLYTFNLTTKKENRLTKNARALAPAYSPDGASIAFLSQKDGTADLKLLDVESGAIRRITDYGGGAQVTEPAWHPDGEHIYYGLSSGGGRKLVRIPVEGAEVHDAEYSISGADWRSPAISQDGHYLYFSSDQSGIFDLYRIELTGNNTAAERLTNVVGGAFMPDVRADGAVAFSRYDWDGYKIALLENPAVQPAPATAYSPPPITRKRGDAASAGTVSTFSNVYDDTDLATLPGGIVTDVATVGSFALDGLRTSDGEQEADRAVERYGGIFTSFSFFPVLRFDNYSSRRESSLESRLPQRSYAATLLRNTKVGFYVSSREILEEMSILGGLLVGPGSHDVESASDFIAPSNLLKLERDAFLLFDYRRGFGLLPKRWSPQISIELYNIRRNVENGLSVEEFPCTACFPDTTLVDLSYSLWEADVYARSKINKNLLLEAGYRYSPYRVVTERFFSKEAAQVIPETGSRYFIGRGLTLGAYFKAEHPHRHSDVLPQQIDVELHYERETGRLLDRFDVEDGVLVPSYQEDVNHRITLDAKVGLRLPAAPHGLALRFRGSTILGSPVDDFYNDYVGGLIGARGYPFYALGGNETLWFQAAYHFPILPDISRQVLFVYLDKLYGRAYVDAAAAWSGEWPGEVRKDVGLELRLGLGSFYLLPTAL